MAIKPIVIGMAALVVLTPAASAQLNRDGGPIEITADRGELNDLQREAVYVGNVDIVQGVARLRAQKVTINYRARSGEGTDGAPSGIAGGIGGLQQITALGEVYYITEKEKVKADAGVYDAEQDTITLTGNVRVTNTDGVIAGENLVIEVATGRYVMDGGEKGGRVRTVIDNSDGDRIQ